MSYALYVRHFNVWTGIMNTPVHLLLLLKESSLCISYPVGMFSIILDCLCGDRAFAMNLLVQLLAGMVLFRFFKIPTQVTLSRVIWQARNLILEARTCSHQQGKLETSGTTSSGSRVYSRESCLYFCEPSQCNGRKMDPRQSNFHCMHL